MILTDKQNKGLKIAIDRYAKGEKYTVISGYAGTGKTTLVKFIIDALSNYNIDAKTEVCYAAYTGKAAEVLRKKGNKNAITLHKLLYDFFPKRDGTFFRKPKEELEYKIVVVDEVSMAPKELMERLFKYNVYVICLGDPFQLPPIDKKEDNHLLDNPHIFLDEVMRQAAESEIIQLTMKIRNKEPIPFIQGKEVQVIKKEELNTGMLLWADQILVATNNTRNNINQQIRQLLGKGDKPEEGDKIICLRNYWENSDIKGENILVNGTVGYIKDCYSYSVKPKLPGKNINIDVLNANFTTDDGINFGSLEIDKQMLSTEKPCVDWKTSFMLSKKYKENNPVPKEFAYAYAVTCHKAQGSEWDKVLVIEERFPFDEEEHARWLYTACTRAANKLVLVR